MKKASLFIPFVLIVLSHGFARAQEGEMPPAPVVVAKVLEMEIRKPVTLIGTVEASKVSTIASRVSGVVTKTYFQEGDYVRKGQSLIQLDTELRSILLKVAEAERSEAEARSDLAEKDYERFLRLHEKGVSSLQDIQDAEAERDAQKARIAQATANVERIKYFIRNSRIRAPFSGYVTAEHTEVGQWVEEGGAVMEVQALSPVEVAVNLPERYIKLIKLESRVKVTFDALPDEEFGSRVISIVPQADKSSRNFRIKLELPNVDSVLLSGMVARVRFKLGNKQVVKLVPKDAIVDSNGSKVVFAVNKGVVAPVPVRVGIEYKDMVSVKGELAPGTEVVVRGNERLRPGQNVRIVNTLGSKKKG